MERENTNRLAEIVELFPCFERVISEAPEGWQNILAEDVSPDLANQRDMLLLETARLYSAWFALGCKLQAERELNARPIM